MANILIIEDDKEISNMLRDYLSQHGHTPTCALNGVEGIRLALNAQHDLILLDLMLPYKSGDELLRELREVSSVPVLVISAKTLTQTKVELLRLGADDYITKPFDLSELLARIEANLKRYVKSAATGNTVLSFRNITMDRQQKSVTVNNYPLTLTAKEYQILELMLSTPQKVFSKQNLYESVWNEPYAYDDNTINTHISNLRKKLKEAGADYIETVWGMGYKLM